MTEQHDSAEHAPPCPRCRAALTVRGGAQLVCSRCRGHFIRSAQRDELAALARALAADPEGGAAQGPYRTAPLTQQVVGVAPDPVVYLRCPLCDEPMNRTRAISELEMVVDRCLAHGAWFDAGELQRAIRAVMSPQTPERWADAIAQMLERLLRAQVG